MIFYFLNSKAIKKYFLSVFLFFFFFEGFGQIVTWDEPWQDDIIRESDYFLLGRVLDARPGSVKIKMLKPFGKNVDQNEITLEGFHMLSVCNSNDSQKITFFFQMIDSVYLFLKKTEIGYCLPTPTSGFAIVANGKVLSTFRHSFHQAQLRVVDYECCMKTIWEHCKEISSTENCSSKLIEKALKKLPSEFGRSDINTFYMQHAALEVIYYTKLSYNFQSILPFLKCNNTHLVISAARCLSNINTDESRKALVELIGDERRDNFTKVIAAGCLKKIITPEWIPKISAIREKANENPIAFSNNPNDPRSCTTLPSLKDALGEILLSEKKD